MTNWFGRPASGVWHVGTGPNSATPKPAALTLDNGVRVDAIAAPKPDPHRRGQRRTGRRNHPEAVRDTHRPSRSPAARRSSSREGPGDGGSHGGVQKDEMGRLTDAVDAKFAAAGQANPSFRDHAAVLLEGRFTGDAVTATVGGWRTDFPQRAGPRRPGSRQGTCSKRPAAIPRGELAAAVDSAPTLLIWCTAATPNRPPCETDRPSPTPRATTMKRDLHPAEAVRGIAFASCWSYPLVADQLPPLLARTTVPHTRA